MSAGIRHHRYLINIVILLGRLALIPPYQPTGPTTATLLGTNGVCTVTQSLTFFIIPNPTVTVSSSTPVICSGQSFTYTSSGASSYTWNPNTTGLNTYTSGVVVANPTISSVFSVAGSSLGCHSATQNNSLTVYSLPVLAVTPDSSAICIGNKINLNVSGANTYTWTGPGNFISYGPASTISSQQVAGPAVYKVIGTSVNNCTASAFATVISLSPPLPVITVSPSNRFCLNSTIKLEGAGGTLYEWEGPDNYTYNGQSVSFIANNPSYEGSYNLTVTSKNGCKAVATTTIALNELPWGSLLGLKSGCTPFCGEFTVDIPASVTTQVFIDDVVSPLNVNPKTHSFKECISEPGLHLFTSKLIDTTTKCANIFEFTVNVFPKPEADFTWSPEYPVEKMDEVVFVNATSSDEQKKWTWFFMPDESHPQNSSPTPAEGQTTIYRFDKEGNYPVALVVRNLWNCLDTVVKTITIDPDFNVFVPNAFSPNGDGINDVFLPIVRGVQKYNCAVFNRWGGKIFQTFDTTKGWDGEYQGEPAKQDDYVYKITVVANSGAQKVLAGKIILLR